MCVVEQACLCRRRAWRNKQARAGHEMKNETDARFSLDALALAKQKKRRPRSASLSLECGPPTHSTRAHSHHTMRALIGTPTTAPRPTVARSPLPAASAPLRRRSTAAAATEVKGKEKEKGTGTGMPRSRRVLGRTTHESAWPRWWWAGVGRWASSRECTPPAGGMRAAAPALADPPDLPLSSPHLSRSVLSPGG